MQVLDRINFFSPLILGLIFIILGSYHVCTSRSVANVSMSSRTKLVTVSLSWTISLTFAILFFLRAFVFQGQQRSSISHALSGTILWASLSVIYQSSNNPARLAFGLTWISTSILEALIVVTSRPGIHHTARKQVGSVVTCLQLFIAVQALILVIFNIHSNRTSNSIHTEHERQSLLADDESWLPEQYSASTVSGTPGNSLDDSDSDSEDDDKEIERVRKRKLEHNGGWFGYLMTFKVFVPHIMPKSNRHKFYAAFILINIIVERITNVLQPLQIGIIIDHLVKTGQIAWPNVVLWIVLGFTTSHAIGVPAIKSVTQYRLTEWAQQRIKIAAFTKIMNLSMAFHDEKESGEVVKAVEQAKSLGDLFCSVVEDILPGIFDLCVAVWYISHLLDFYAVHIIVAMMLGFTFTTAFMVKYTAAAQRAKSVSERSESKMVYETIEHWSTVSYFDRKRYEIGRLSEVTSQYARAEIRDMDWYAALWALQEAWELVAHYSIALIALYRISIGASSVGTFITFESYWEVISMPLYMLGNTYRHISGDMISAERLIQLFDTDSTVKEISGAKQLKVSQGEIKFDHVDFAYQDYSLVHHDLNFTALPGTTTAFVGETGSGKSSILKLLMRFYDVSAGTISIDGQDVSKLTLSSLRSAFGIVPQDLVLFNTSILENVRYGRLEATDSDVYEACQAAQIHDKILAFPHGYASKCGERGIKLSGGEKQRLAIARVLLKKPDIILLDEATSAMDTNVEEAIQNSLKLLMKGRTAIVIAHRLSTIVEADQILLMEAGSIVERGTHKELVELGGRYARLWEKQSDAVSKAVNGDLLTDDAAEA